MMPGGSGGGQVACAPAGRLISAGPLRLNGVSPSSCDLPDADRRIGALLEQVGLSNRRRDPVRTFSRGMVQRLAIARAILHDPAIMLLDEPYTGLDLQAAEMLGGFLRELATSGRTVVLTTHNLEQGLEMCSRAAILDRGRITWLGERCDVDPERMKEIYREATSQPVGARNAGRDRG